MEQANYTDVAIVGGGLAGSLAAAMLAQNNVDCTLIDPRTEYPDEFRCEKFDASQIELLQQTGLAVQVFEALTPVSDVWVCRYGKLLRKQNYPHYGFSYRTAVNALRQFKPVAGTFRQGNVLDIQNSGSRKTLKLSDGSELTAKLVVLATGAGAALQEQLGFTHSMVSERHCLAIGFDVNPKDKSDFAFDTLTYWPETVSGKMSYLTIFRAGDGWRANLFGYWNLKGEDTAALRQNPHDFLCRIMPKLETVCGRFEVTGKLRIRPINLYQWDGSGVDGVVAIGDAWSSSCPGAGTGTTKVINDTLRLCNDHIPFWLAAEKFDASSLQSFYCDPQKVEVDAQSKASAYKLRSLTLEQSLYWQTQRFLRFAYHGMRGRLTPLIG